MPHATKSKKKKNKQNNKAQQAQGKVNSPKGGLGTKADLDASFVPYLNGEKAEAPKAQVPISADPSAETESVKDATYKKVEGERFVQGEGDEQAIDPNDVKQGSLGNCYLVAALSAVAKTDPKVIEDMIQDNGDGTYTVSFYLKEGRIGVFSSGSKVSIRVSNEFPMRGNNPAFAKKGDEGPKGPELWVMIIEKAWAVHQGTYEQSRGSKVEMNTDIMSFITGQQTRSLFCSGTSEAELLKALNAGSEGKHPMTASMPNKTLASEEVIKAAEEKGLYFNHAYTIMTVDKEGKNIILRNPWGSHDPKPMTVAELKKIFSQVKINAA